MSNFITAANSAVAWTKIMEFLIDQPQGKYFHLVTAIANPQIEVKEFTRIIDDLAKATGATSTMENANVLWPHVLAPRGQSFETTMKRMREFAAPLIKEANPRHADSYLERLVAWRSKEGGIPVPQLDNVIERMKKEAGYTAPKSSAYDIAIFSPGLDPGYMSFPCLSYLSFKLDSDRNCVHLSALYRNHHFISHGYGNFIGLGRLMHFVASQVGVTVGELLCISTHADAELNRGKLRIQDAVSHAKILLEGKAGVVDGHARAVVTQ